MKVKYNSLMVFCRKQFGTKIKVARKSPINKDEKAVETFKKTLVASATKPSRINVSPLSL